MSLFSCIHISDIHLTNNTNAEKYICDVNLFPKNN